MFIAHAPAGYLLTRYLQRKTGSTSCRVVAAGLVASVFPDIDLLYFYLVDHRQVHHHQYVTHLPLAWLLLGLAAGGILKLTGKMRWMIFVTVILANAMLHLFLDTLAGDVFWLYPLRDTPVSLVTVPAHYHWWVWNFLLHWTFALELLIIGIALWTWKRPCKKLS